MQTSTQQPMHATRLLIAYTKFKHTVALYTGAANYWDRSAQKRIDAGHSALLRDVQQAHQELVAAAIVRGEDGEIVVKKREGKYGTHDVILFRLPAKGELNDTIKGHFPHYSISVPMNGDVVLPEFESFQHSRIIQTVDGALHIMPLLYQTTFKGETWPLPDHLYNKI